MARDARDILEVLKFELNFLEQGGYGRAGRMPWKPVSMFQDSLICLNFGEPQRPHPCEECMLMDFVPDKFRNENVPCHYIPLDASGESIASLDQGYNQPAVEEAVAGWLRRTIARVERERIQRAAGD